MTKSSLSPSTALLFVEHSLQMVEQKSNFLWRDFYLEVPVDGLVGEIGEVLSGVDRFGEVLPEIRVGLFEIFHTTLDCLAYAFTTPFRQ